MDASQRPEMTEHQKQQLQFQLFQDSLPKVNEIVYRMLLNEAIPMAVNVQDRLSEESGGHEDNETEQGLEQDLDAKLTFDPLKDHVPSHKLLQKYLTADEEYQNKVDERLNNIGFLLGQKLSQLLIFSNNPSLNFRDMDLLAVMKFVCRDVWRQLFGKQIDNLKTNHRGTFYLLDNNYKPVESFALDEDMSQEEQTLIEPYLEIPCGVIRGVLDSLGFQEKGQVICTASITSDRESQKTGSSASSRAVLFNVQINPDR
ncbi:LAME_0H06700g1_1 [Lachancea meyersii CBS 8951]|uniref:LAME_0H06700g1_1 n=1 Tax=Lachancea meyersii CBS 8951 TaxID=1266667 RepID=A0A1G4KEL8_9SACH|nr:LAME_0H06700g1_1 [Lachancea meyersii CBS 8951]